MSNGITNFIEVDPDCLLPGTQLGVDIYILQDARHVLYRRAELPFTEENRQNLVESGHELVYIAARDRRQFQLYVEATIAKILDSPRIVLEKKSKIVYDVTTYLMKDVFSDPRDGDKIKRSKRLVKHTVDLLRSGREASKQLMRLTAHDYRTYTHSVNTTIFAIGLCERVFHEENGIDFYELGCGFLLHDLGKSQIDLKILNKPGPLSDEEWGVMKKHPEYGCELLDAVGELSDTMKPIVLEHHEHYQGGGYPTGKAGEAIHPYGRICCLCDTFDALTTERTYRRAFTTFEALTTMQGEMVDQFDPQYFEQLVLLFEE